MKLVKIIDNNRKSLKDVFKDLDGVCDQLSIATGYWDLEAMKEILPQLRRFKKIRLLIGKEPLIPRYNLQKPESDYPDQDFKFDLADIRQESDLKDLVSEIKEWMDLGKLEVRVYRKNFLHAKCFIFGSYISKEAIGIIGSSNFTKNGLTHNTELNALESDQRIVVFKPSSLEQEIGHLYWFDSFWNDDETEKWNEQFGSILELSPVGDVLYSPYETYIKTLYELYKEEIIDDEIIDLSSEKGRTLFDFQHKNVQALLRRLKKYKVAMLADSVGLGKTLTAINVIKQYLEDEQGKKRVEIICPKSLVQQWEKELATEEIFGLRPVTLQNVNEIERKRELDEIASVSLFVIDESHNLRRSSGKRFKQLLDWIRGNPKVHVLLLTATPINNQLTDLTTQILLGTGGSADGLKLTIVDRNKQTEQRNFYQIVENLKKKTNQDLRREGKIDYNHIKQVMTPIIRTFVVRRTRQGIEKEYGSLLIDGEERRFPKVIPEVLEYEFGDTLVEKLVKINSKKIPLKEIYELDPEQIVEKCKDLKHPLDQLKSIKKTENNEQKSPLYFIFQLILMLGFVPYRWMMYQTNHYGKTREDIRELKLSSAKRKKLFQQLSIFGILRTVFLKRMESSVSALRSSLENYLLKLKFFEEGIEQGQIISMDDLNLLVSSLEDEDIEIDEELLKESVLDKVDDKKYELEALKLDIEREKEIVELIQKQLDILNENDAKIKCFSDKLRELREKYPNQKVLIFSYFADTVKYLEENINKYCNFLNESNTSFISSKNKNDSEKTASLFSPKSKKYKLKEGEKELQYLFSTDVLSEGQNLQDSAILINYDLHWNPVRMIQRNGRVNRLGTDFNEVYIYNMRPEEKLDSYLKLIQRLQGKIDIIKNTIGTDVPVLDEAENPIEYTDSVSDIYSKDFETRIKALDDAEKASDFLLSEDEFVIDLKKFNSNPNYSEEYKEAIYSISDGKWAILPKSEVRGEKRADVFGLLRLYPKDESDSLGYQFAQADLDGLRIQAISHLQALEWIKATPEDNKRVKDDITANKVSIKERLEENIVSYFGKEETGSLIGQENKILKILYENQYSQEEIDLVRDVFKASNVFYKRDVNQLKRKIVAKYNKNKVYQQELRDLIKLAKKVNNQKEEETITAFKEAKGILFYVNKNE